jgi:hypothetical protein
LLDAMRQRAKPLHGAVISARRPNLVEQKSSQQGEEGHHGFGVAEERLWYGAP